MRPPSSAGLTRPRHAPDTTTDTVFCLVAPGQDAARPTDDCLIGQRPPVTALPRYQPPTDLVSIGFNLLGVDRPSTCAHPATRAGDTAKGEHLVEGVVGSCKLKTPTGDIRVEQATGVQLKTTGGGTRVDALSG